MTESIKFDVELDTGAGLQVIMHPADEPADRFPATQLLQFTYRYMSVDRREVKLQNMQRLYVKYRDGLVHSVEVTMHVIIPERPGKKAFLGVDISPGAKTFVEFRYQPDGPDAFRLFEIQIGRKLLELDKLGDALVQPLDFPFPVLERIVRKHPAHEAGEPNYGPFQVPFLHDSDEVRYFEFDGNIRLHQGGPKLQAAE